MTAKAIPFTKVILDAGHGGHDLGGTFGLTYEKHLALDVVRRVDTYLKSQGISTKLTRSRDNFISLQRRARIAMPNQGQFLLAFILIMQEVGKRQALRLFIIPKIKTA